MEACVFFPPGTITITKGSELIRDYIPTKPDALLATSPANRRFCSVCGTRVIAILLDSALAGAEGVYPALINDEAELPATFMPTFQQHVCDAVVAVPALPACPPK